MKTEHPSAPDIPVLRRLWTAAFGDAKEFLDGFFRTGFSPDRCLCLRENGVLAAALYWFDCSCRGQKIAYIYAVATDPVFRGRGFCRSLMDSVHGLLRDRGYAGAVLVPGSDSLRKMYENMGYATCTYVREFSCKAGSEAAALRGVSPAEYAKIRCRLLPAGSVVQEGANLTFLATGAQLFATGNALLAAELSQNAARIVEFLGDPDHAPAILKALGRREGTFRSPGAETPFAMFLPLSENATAPSYFGLAFD